MYPLSFKISILSVNTELSTLKTIPLRCQFFLYYDTDEFKSSNNVVKIGFLTVKWSYPIG